MMPHKAEIREQLAKLDARLEGAHKRNEAIRQEWFTHFVDSPEGAREIEEYARQSGIPVPEAARRKLAERLGALEASSEEDPADAVDRAFKEAGDHA